MFLASLSSQGSWATSKLLDIIYSLSFPNSFFKVEKLSIIEIVSFPSFRGYPLVEPAFGNVKESEESEVHGVAFCMRKEGMEKMIA